MNALDPRLRALLVCPLCRGDLTDHPEGLVCRPCERLFPIVEGIPHLVHELARRVPEGP